MFSQEKIIIVLFSFLLLLSISSQTVAASEILSAQAIWGGQAVEYYNPEVPIALDIELQLQEDSNSTARAYTLKNFNKQGDKNGVITMCFGQGEITCLIPGIILHTENSTPQLQVHLTNATGTTQLNYTFSFEKDNTRPEVSILEAGFCADQCYVNSESVNEMRIVMEDPVGSFHKKKIAFRLGSKAGLVDSCEGLSCQGRTLTTCSDATEIGLSIDSYRGSYSQDDAGNPLTGKLSSLVICDAQNPEFTSNFSLSSESGTPTEHPDAQRPFISLSDVLIVKINASDSVSPSLSILAELEALGLNNSVGECTKTTDHFECNIEISPLLDEPKNEIEIPIIIRDLVGRETRKILVIDVLEGNEGSAHFWRLRSNPPAHQVNKHFLEFTPKKLFTVVQLTPVSPQKQLILATRAGSCSAIEGQGTNADIQKMDVLTTTENTLFIRSYMNMGSYYSQFPQTKYNCSIEVLTKAGAHISKYYETIVFELSVDFHDTETLGEMVSDEVKEVMEKANERAKKVAELKATVNLIKTACAPITAAKTVGGTMSSSAVGLLAFPPSQPAGRVMAKLGSAVSGIVETIPYLVQGCQISSCSSDYNYLIMDQVGKIPGVEQTAKAMGYSSFRETLNPYNSMITSALMLCPAGLLYHQERWQGVECEYAACLSRDVGGGQATIEDCQKIRSYNKCVFIYGGVFNAIPLAGAFKETMGLVVDVITDPATLLISGGSIFACVAADPSGGMLHAVCGVSASFNGAIDAYNAFRSALNQIKKVVNNPIGKSACDTVRERISTTDTYWNYVDEETQRFDYATTSKYGYNCNQLGCSKTTGTEENKITRTYIPVDNGNRVRVFENGREVQLEEEDLPGIEAAQQYHTEWLEEAQKRGYENYIDESEVLFTAESNFQRDRARLERAEIQAQGNYDALDQFRDALEEIGKYNDQVAKDKLEYERKFEEYVEKYNANIDTPAYRSNSRLTEEMYNQLTSQERASGAQTFTITTDQAREMMEKGQIPTSNDLIKASSKINRNTKKLTAAISTVEKAKEADPQLAAAIDKKLAGKEVSQLSEAEAKSIANDAEVKTTSEGAKDNAKAILETATQEKEKSEDAHDDQTDTTIFAEYQDRDWNKFTDVMRSSLRLARNVNQFGPSISKAVFGQKFTVKMRGAIMDLMGPLGNIIQGDWENAVCERKLGTGNEALRVSRIASTSYVNSAHIEGIQLLEGFSGDDLNYTYIINTYVVNHNVDRDLVFTVYLDGSQGKRSLVEEEVSLAKEEAFDRTKAQALTYTGIEDYEKVCLEFYSPTLSDWFGSATGRVFCKRLAYE